MEAKPVSVYIPLSNGKGSFYSFVRNTQMHIAIVNDSPGDAGDAEIITDEMIVTELIDALEAATPPRPGFEKVSLVQAIDVYPGKGPSGEGGIIIVQNVENKEVQLIIAERDPGEIILDAIPLLLDPPTVARVVDTLKKGLADIAVFKNENPIA